MSEVVQISLSDWHLFLDKLAVEWDVFVPVKFNQSIDYKHYRSHYTIPYNQPLPVTPLKYFFLPVQENVVFSKPFHNKRLIIGIPSCDLHALELLDEIYLQEPYPDLNYKENRENTVLIGTDCHSIKANCHCTTYGGKPFPEMHADLNLVNLDDSLLLTIITAKGAALIGQYRQHFHTASPDQERVRQAEARRSATQRMLEQQNHGLPDYPATGDLVLHAGDAIWDKHAKTCVSCGACATICPTCTCFLLIDRPGFEKVRQVDACQYPGFEKIAAGEDPLHRKSVRFKNRYLCKYVWKPERFKSVACTGCGRCIDCCIGKISKNEIFLELAQQS